MQTPEYSVLSERPRTHTINTRESTNTDIHSKK
jgi:hypothetical protein